MFYPSYWELQNSFESQLKQLVNACLLPLGRDYSIKDEKCCKLYSPAPISLTRITGNTIKELHLIVFPELVSLKEIGYL